MYALIALALFAAFLGLASQLGWTVDSRDNSGWKPTGDGVRTPSSRS
jgi:hypothetical protein